MTGPTEADPAEACPLFRLPLEVRDLIYQMLLTTPYCVRVAPNGMPLEFRLSTAILRANKRILVEASRVLREDNDFITLKVTGVHLDLYYVPTFNFLGEDSVIYPVLQAQIEVEASGHQREKNRITLITNPEGLQPVIRAIWRLHGTEISDPSAAIHLGDLKLSLNFNVKASARYELLSNLALEPWTKINGIKKLILTGDIQIPMRDHLQYCIHKGPFPDEVAVRLQEYYSLAEKEVTRKRLKQRGRLTSYDCSTAQWWWTTLEDYWRYLSELRPYRLRGLRLRESDDKFRNVLRVFIPTYLRAKLEKVKKCLRQWNFREAVVDVDMMLSYRWLRTEWNHTFNPLLSSKFYLCGSLALSAIGEREAGMEWLEDTARTLASKKQYSNQGNWEDLINDLQRIVNSELIRMGSIYRCEWPLSAIRGWRRMGWEEGEGSFPFWEWVDSPQE
jgi:hypothetical protein